jgi:serine/threonine protein kinase
MQLKLLIPLINAAVLFLLLLISSQYFLILVCLALSAVIAGLCFHNGILCVHHFYFESTPIFKSTPMNKFLDEYIIEKKLGRGANSVVMLGRRKKTNQCVAIKIVNLKKGKEMEKLNMEIDILKSLNHPNIIKIYTVYRFPEDCYIITELVAGGEVFDRVCKRTYYSEKLARDLIKTCLETIMYIHQRGIVHRDLKLENLLLVSQENDTDVKVLAY